MAFYRESDTKLSHTTSCSSCKLYLKASNPKLEATGSGKNGILLLLPQPSEAEDVQGVCGVGSDNAWLKMQLESIDISWNDCTIVNVIGCHTSEMKGIHNTCCLNRLERIIQQVKPRLVIAFGNNVLQSTVGQEWTRNLGDIVKWHGFIIPKRNWNCWLVHTFYTTDVVNSPSYNLNERWRAASTAIEKARAVEKTGRYKIYTRYLKEDIRRAYKKSFEPIPDRPEDVSPVSVLSEDEAVVWMETAYAYLKNNPKALLACDLETSGLKCYNKNQFAYSIAFMYDKSVGSAGFLITNKTIPYIQKLFSLNPRIVGANWKFDYCWCRNKLNCNPENLYADVVILSHLLNNKDDITSLKFNTFWRYGIAYEDTVHKYLVADGTNALNRIKEAPIHDLLYYNALDVVYTMYCALDQLEEWNQETNPNKDFAFKLFHKGSIALAKMELHGIKMDLDKAKESYSFCESKLKEIEESIKDEPVWKEWQSIYKEKTSLVSDAQIIDIFIKRKGLWPRGISKNVKPKADHEWLNKMVDQEPFIQYILNKRKYEKMATTYLKSYFDETNDDGKIRAFNTLNNVASFRMASNSPNLMNQSSRIPEQVQLLKSCFVPDNKKCCLLSCDFSGLENNISANITKDPYMIASLDGGVDMHKDNCLYVFFTNDEEFHALKQYDEEHHTKYAKALRNGGKTASFAALFGSAKQTMGESLWKAMDDNDLHVTPTETAKNRAIKALNMQNKYEEYLNDCRLQGEAPMEKAEFFYLEYEEYIDGFIKDFWNNRMKVTKEWRDHTYQKYLETGKVEYPTGLTIRDIMTRNSLLNGPVQGSGSCVTLFCLCRLIKLIEQKKLKSFPVLVIHDDIVSNVYEDEVVEYVRLLKQVMEVETQQVFPWLTVPLHAEPEITFTNWAEKQEYKEENYL